MPRNSVYVISDLHLGGDPTEPCVPGGRGFQICRQGARAALLVRTLADRPPGSVELVVNGDIVDFLAEHPSTGGWTPFHRDAAEATRILRLIANQRERELFDALREFVRAEHRLTLILGNHDLELSLPAVRQALYSVLEAPRGQLQFVYDNEAYVAGKAVIEHGNRADSMNEVDHDMLRRVRVLQSRRADNEEAAPFVPPVGSRLVAELMNPQKERFPFIDLLKPEAEAMVPILLALEPSVLRRLPRLLSFGAIGGAKAAVNRVASRYGDAIASLNEDGDPVGELLARTLGREDASALLSLVQCHGAVGGDISASGPPAWRISLALRILRRLVREDRTFDMAGEASGRYREAAARHIANGFQAVVFGHTHRACREVITTPGGTRGVYLNSGTWIDLIQVPQALLEGGDAAAATTRRFVEDLLAGKLEDWVLRRPAYVKLELGAAGEVERAALCIYSDPDPDSPDNLLSE